MRNLKTKLARLLIIACASATLVFGMQPSTAAAGGRGGVIRQVSTANIGGPIGGGGGG